MEGRKDISDMSFEEFFSKKGEESVVPQTTAKSVKPKAYSGGEVQMGFGAAMPKLNLNGRVFELYVPRYGSGTNARFDVSLDCESGLIPMGQLSSMPKGSGRLSRPTTLNITDAGISPFERFALVIDGSEVYINKPRNILYFNNVGMPMNKAAGDAYVVYPSSSVIRAVRADIKETFAIGSTTVVHAEVSLAGGIWIDDSKVKDGPTCTDEQKTSVDEGKVEEDKPKAKKVRRKKPLGSIKMPQGIQSADASISGVTVPIYDKFPVFEVKVENREYDECAVSLTRLNGDTIIDGKAPVKGPMFFETECTGSMSLVLRCDGETVLSTTPFILIPDFRCERGGNGDLGSDPAYTLTAFGKTDTHHPVDGPVEYECDGQAFELVCYAPYIEYDVGAGLHTFDCCADIEDCDVDMLGDRIRIKVYGARKFSFFIGPDKGKKVELDLSVVGDVFVADLEPFKAQIYSSKGEKYTIFVTVNSFPMHKLMTISNPIRVTATCKDGVLSADVKRKGSFECRFYMKDKSVHTVDLVMGENKMDVPSDSVEAEVVEIADGAVRTSIPVSVRQLPFLDRDETGEVWMFISKDKRIPLPESLSKSRPDSAAIRQWHDQIVRMNPELKSVTSAMMQSAFDSMRW